MKKSELKSLIRECIEEELNEAKKPKVKMYSKSEVAKLKKQLQTISKNLPDAVGAMEDLDFEAYEDILMSDARLTSREFDKLIELAYKFSEMISMRVDYLDAYVRGGGAVTGGEYGTQTMNSWKEENEG